MKTTESTLHKLATELSQAFEHKTRSNGDDYVCLKNGSPQWMQDAIHEAHENLLPNDAIYSLCERVADCFADADEESGEEELREALDEIEIPPYTKDRMVWFAQNWEYCDRAIADGLWNSDNPKTDVTELVACGMMLHLREIGETILATLVKQDEDK